MHVLEEKAWSKVETALLMAHSVAFDGCHKIYVHADKAGTDESRKNGYGDGSDSSRLLLVSELNSVAPNGALNTVKAWFEESCALRFINLIVGDGTKNEHYHRLIAQGEEDEWEDVRCTCFDGRDEPCEKCG